MSVRVPSTAASKEQISFGEVSLASGSVRQRISFGAHLTCASRHRMYNLVQNFYLTCSLRDLREHIQKFVLQYPFRGSVRKHQAWKNLTFLFLKETLLKENLQLAEEQIGSQSQQRLHQSSSHLR